MIGKIRVPARWMIVGGVALLSPRFALAVKAPKTFAELVGIFFSLANALVPFIAALSLLAFFWGVARFILAKGDEERFAGKKFMLWGILSMFVMVSIWGILALIITTVGFPFVIPSLPIPKK